MRSALFTSLFTPRFTSLFAFLLVGCLEESAKGESDTRTDDAVNITFYTSDYFDVVPDEASVGDTIEIDVSELSYDRTEAYTWAVWTGDVKSSGVWNSLVLGDVNISEEVHRFSPTFPGFYKISWCPTNAHLECVLFGELKVTGDVPVNEKPSVDLFYEDDTVVKTLCSVGCRQLIDTGQDIRIDAQITDPDDEVHSLNWWGRLAYKDGYVKNEANVQQTDLSFTPNEQGSYTFSIKTFDGHLTVDGRQFTQSYWYFTVRDADNELPTTSFSMVGHDGVTASMEFNYDSAKKQYYPVIDYYYENTFSIDDCVGIPGCDNELVHFDLYQNNRGAEEIPVFTMGDTVAFNGSASSDPEGEELYYLWSGFNDDVAGNLIGSLPNGENNVNYSLTVTEPGNYYVTLCVQEAEHLSIYNGYANEWQYLQFLPLQKCPQIQFKVAE